MGLQFQAPNIPGLVRQPADIPRSIDDIFNNYQQSKNQAFQQGLAMEQQKRQQAQDARQARADADAEGNQMASQGFLGRDVPAIQAYAASGQQNPAAPEGAFGQGSQAMAENPMEHLKRAFESFQSNKKRSADAVAQKATDESANTQADTRKKNAEADAYGNEQVFVDPTSGKQFRVPKGAKLMPAGTGNDGKILPASNVVSLNEGQAVARMLPEVESALKENESLFGPVTGRVGGANPYDTKSQTVDARFRTASQAFGRFMEGGVLRKEDEEKYRKMFPQLSDTAPVAKNKLSIVRRQLAQKYESDRDALGGAGYNTSGAGRLDIPPSLFGAAQGGDSASIVKAGLAAGKSREQIKAELKAAGH